MQKQSRGIGSVITLICTRHAYLTSGHLICLLCQASTEKLFLKTPFLKTHASCSTTACVYTLADPLQPACTYKSTKNGNLLTKHTVLGKLTKPFDHGWLVTRLNTYLLIAYKRRVRSPIGKEGKS
jgi:hypothetical protein